MPLLAPEPARLSLTHVDSRQYGKGPLSRATELQPGDRATVIGEGGSREYVVDAVRAYEKVVLPWQELFAQDLEERMILITCGGDFDAERRSYLSNIVVFFTPAWRAPPTRLRTWRCAAIEGDTRSITRASPSMITLT